MTPCFENLELAQVHLQVELLLIGERDAATLPTSSKLCNNAARQTCWNMLPVLVTQNASLKHQGSGGWVAFWEGGGGT